MSLSNISTNENIEFSSKEEIEEYQLSLLAKQWDYAKKKSPFYTKLFLSIEATNFTDIPFTVKNDLSISNDSFLAIDKEDIAEICTTSGSTGNQVSIYLSKNDLERLALNEYASFQKMGIQKKDIVQLMLTLDKQFMAGIAYYSGLLHTDATIIRGGPANPEIQLNSLIKNKVTCLIAIPSAILKLIEYAKEISFDLTSLPLKKILCIGETIYTKQFEFNLLSTKIRQTLSVELFSTYASSEMQTAFTDCSFHIGLHINPTLLFVEVIDEQGNQVQNREVGEVVITPLGTEGMPLLRYKTEDICEYISEPCKCGRNTIRLGPVLGRKSQMLKLNGTTIFPMAINQILSAESNIADFVLIASKDLMGLDKLTIHLKPINSDISFITTIEKRLQSLLRVSISIIECSETEIKFLRGNINSSKAVKFIDNRGLN